MVNFCHHSPLIEMSSVDSLPASVLHIKLISKSKALKKKRTALERRRLRDHRQEASGGYFNGQLGVKTVPSEDLTKDVLQWQNKKMLKLILARSN